MTCTHNNPNNNNTDSDNNQNHRRSQPLYDAKITNVQGPVANTQLSGPVVQGMDGLQYLQVGSQFIPLSTPQGMQLLAPTQMQAQLNQDIYRVQQQYQQPQQQQVVYTQTVHHGHHGHDKKAYKKMKGHKKKGYKIKLF